MCVCVCVCVSDHECVCECVCVCHCFSVPGVTAVERAASRDYYNTIQCAAVCIVSLCCLCMQV